VFVFLALSFALGFVLFNVGGENAGGGIAELFRGRATSSGPSVESAQEKVDENPRDPAALRELATALQAEGDLDKALPVLERYSRLMPKDENALQELAGLYSARAGRIRNEAQLAQARAQLATPDALVLPPPTTPLGQALADRPISNAVSAAAQAELTEKIEQMQAAFRRAQQTYQRLAVLQPDNAQIQLQLADAAVNAGDNTVALAAYKRFLELAPDDPQAPLVEEQVKRLEGPASAPSG
jgi:tetratricopeptide (TPR) repeat protein